MSHARIARRIAVALAASLALAAHAGGPLVVCNSAPVKYPGTGTVNLNYDGGGTLGSRTKAQADAIITSAVALWTNVPTATVVIGRGADLPVDVTLGNLSTLFRQLHRRQEPRHLRRGRHHHGLPPGQRCPQQRDRVRGLGGLRAAHLPVRRGPARDQRRHRGERHHDDRGDGPRDRPPDRHGPHVAGRQPGLPQLELPADVPDRLPLERDTRR